MKEKIENYTGVCWYCGAIFQSIRSDAKHCSNRHRSLRGKLGPQIKAEFLDPEGKLFNADVELYWVYNNRPEKNEDDWSYGHSHYLLTERFGYRGPLPTGSELLVVGSYLIKLHFHDEHQRDYYLVKPITHLTPDEKASCHFVSAKELQKEAELHQSLAAADAKEQAKRAFVDELSGAMAKMKATGQPLRFQEETN